MRITARRTRLSAMVAGLGLGTTLTLLIIFNVRREPPMIDSQLRQIDTQLQKTDTQLQKTDTQLQKTDTQPQKTDTQLQKTDTELKGTDTQPQKTGAELPKTDVSKDSAHQDHDDVKIKPSKDCAVCKSGVPCEYPKEVDIRIIVLGFNRDKSLQKCLDRIQKLVLNGAKIAVDIFIDVELDHSFHKPTYKVAQNFASSWRQGQACVHVQNEHSYIAKQWMFSWRPRENTKEMVLILEDDVDISPYAAQWLLLANKTFFDDSSVYSYSLQSENVCGQQSAKNIRISASKAHTAYKMPILGTWGFSPKGNFWRRFQDWYGETRSKTPSYKPYIEAFKTSEWFKHFEKKGTEQSMAHEMWLTHFMVGHREKLYCVYNNLRNFTGKAEVQLSSHRAEDGLHYTKKAKSDDKLNLLMNWEPSYGNFKKDCPTFDAFGNLVLNF